jgi:hypothetical protein
MDNFLIWKNLVKIQPECKEAASTGDARFTKPGEPKEKAVK